MSAMYSNGTTAESTSKSESLETSEIEVMFIVAALVSLIFANATSTCIHRCGSDKETGKLKGWVQSFPESMIVLSYGLIVGGILIGIVNYSNDGTDEEVVSQLLLRAAIFQADTFNLVLLPIIIFTSGFTLKPKSLFFNLLAPILVLAIVGTLICAAIIGGGIYLLATVLPGLAVMEVSLYTAMTYGSLLAAIDPVATLSIFVNLKVDPVLSMLLFGESVINDAVSIVLFDVFAIYATATPDVLAELPVSAGFVTFFTSFFGSIGIALLITLVVTVYFKFLKPAHEAQQMIVVFFFSYLSFEVADALGLSGITSSLFSGIFMGYLVPKNLTHEATVAMRKTFGMVAEMAESIVFFQIGVNCVITLNQMESLFLMAISVFILCLLARLIAVPLQLMVLNLCRRPEKKFTLPQAVIMIHAGLRGAIAYALCLEFPVIAFAETATNITTLVILLSIFLIGPTTAPLLKCMKVPVGVAYEVNHGRTYFSKWQVCFDNFSKQHVVNFLSRGRSSSSMNLTRARLSHSDELPSPRLSLGLPGFGDKELLISSGSVQENEDAAAPSEKFKTASSSTTYPHTVEHIGKAEFELKETAPDEV